MLKNCIKSVKQCKHRKHILVVLLYLVKIVAVKTPETVYFFAVVDNYSFSVTMNALDSLMMLLFFWLINTVQPPNLLGYYKFSQICFVHKQKNTYWTDDDQDDMSSRFVVVYQSFYSFWTQINRVITRVGLNCNKTKTQLWKTLVAKLFSHYVFFKSQGSRQRCKYLVNNGYQQGNVDQTYSLYTENVLTICIAWI